MFKLVSKFKPTGDQPRAIEKLTKNLKAGVRHQTLLGVTGSGKTFTAASVIEKMQKPALIVCHNKTLAAQTFQEFKEFFPGNAVHYFVSYYDYYQPEAYIPQSDTYIEKDSRINEEIDRLRHAAVQDLLTRKDIIVVASVSCIYNIGSPENYQKVCLEIKQGQKIKRRGLVSGLVSLQYQRNDIDFEPGFFRARGNMVEIFSVTGTEIIGIEFNGDKISLITKSPANGNSFEISKIKHQAPKVKLFPAHFWIAPEQKLSIAIENIKLELQEEVKKLKKKGKLLEAQRLQEKTNYDLEALKETGFCHGIENYSRHLEFRSPGQAPFTLLDYFNCDLGLKDKRELSDFSPSRFLVFIDESHITLPQIRAMAVQDRIRKKTLIEHGFRLPSAIDNRPLTYKEFEKIASQTVCVSATPSKEEKKKSGKYFVEQMIRPTGLLEPPVKIRPINNQINDLIKEIKKSAKKGERVLVLALTKRLAEAVAEHLAEEKISCQWLHSEIKTLKRPQILKDLREGKYDALVGINLLREGLDLPEVALVAILDADKEGFLRSETTLVQIMGRAARHQEGRVILYADKITGSMARAIKEIKRRREIQQKYNKKHKITPRPIIKPVRDWPFAKKEIKEDFWKIKERKILEKEMKKAAQNMDFEKAAKIRDMINEIQE